MEDGISNPLRVKTVMEMPPAYDMSHWDLVYSNALSKVGEPCKNDTDEHKVFGGMFVKSSTKKEEPKKVISHEKDLFEKCEGRTARRTVLKKRKLIEEVIVEEDPQKVEESKKEKKEKKDKKKKKKKKSKKNSKKKNKEEKVK